MSGSKNSKDKKYLNFIPESYVNHACDAKQSRQKSIRILLEKRKIPELGWDDINIEYLLNDLAQMDNNNFLKICGLGEREARIACGLVAKRHYNLAHGIGRSGDLAEPQPKAAGSSVMAQLTNCLLLDLIRMMGIRSCVKCILVPMATGMSLMFSFLALKLKKPGAKYVLWSRIDQKSCFKSMITAGVNPIIIEPILIDNELRTDIKMFEDKIKELGADNILAIFSTSSCFAPRSCDNIIELSRIATEYDLFHVVNNAYGLQTTFLTHQIEQGHHNGRIDLFIQSTDKNLLVPVGGAVIAGFDTELIDFIAKCYVGRCSISQTVDVFMTLLSLGRTGYKSLIETRKENFQYLKTCMVKIAADFHETLYLTKNNPISIAMTLKSFNQSQCSEIGSMLFTRGVSGARVVNLLDHKNIEGHEFVGWGCHSSYIKEPYITVAAAIGLSVDEINVFCEKLTKILQKESKNNRLMLRGVSNSK